jgi:hypothetical protein
MPDREIVERLEKDFQNDLKHSRQITYEEWKRRPQIERVQEWMGWFLKNQQ